MKSSRVSKSTSKGAPKSAPKNGPPLDHKHRTQPGRPKTRSGPRRRSKSDDSAHWSEWTAAGTGGLLLLITLIYAQNCGGSDTLSVPLRRPLVADTLPPVHADGIAVPTVPPVPGVPSVPGSRPTPATFAETCLANPQTPGCQAPILLPDPGEIVVPSYLPPLKAPLDPSVPTEPEGCVASFPLGGFSGAALSAIRDLPKSYVSSQVFDLVELDAFFEEPQGDTPGVVSLSLDLTTTPPKFLKACSTHWKVMTAPDLFRTPDLPIRFRVGDGFFSGEGRFEFNPASLMTKQPLWVPHLFEGWEDRSFIELADAIQYRVRKWGSYDGYTKYEAWIRPDGLVQFQIQRVDPAYRSTLRALYQKRVN